MASELRPHFHQQGMTLLELLVTMTLLALVSSLLMQGFSSALSTYERVQRKQTANMPLELGYRWFADTLAGTMAELDPPRQFTGDEHTLSGVTQSPLSGLPGQILFFTWRLEDADDGSLRLIYSQPGQTPWQIAQWPAGSTGHFIYRSLEGSPVDHWPDTAPQTRPPADGRIPGAILLEITPPDTPPIHWYANLPGRTFPRSDYRDL